MMRRQLREIAGAGIFVYASVLFASYSVWDWCGNSASSICGADAANFVYLKIIVPFVGFSGLGRVNQFAGSVTRLPFEDLDLLLSLLLIGAAVFLIYRSVLSALLSIFAGLAIFQMGLLAIAHDWSESMAAGLRYYGLGWFSNLDCLIVTLLAVAVLLSVKYGKLFKLRVGALGMFGYDLHDLTKKYAKFAIIGALGIPENAAILYVLVQYGGLWYVLAEVIAAGIVGFINFGGNVLWKNIKIDRTAEKERENSPDN